MHMNFWDEHLVGLARIGSATARSAARLPFAIIVAYFEYRAITSQVSGLAYNIVSVRPRLATVIHQIGTRRQTHDYQREEIQYSSLFREHARAQSRTHTSCEMYEFPLTPNTRTNRWARNCSLFNAWQRREKHFANR
jgi:hypothetical protein